MSTPALVLLTGDTGTGKSTLLNQLRRRDGVRTLFIDPLGAELVAWGAPLHPEAFDGVAIDHAQSLDNPAEQLAAVQAWCAQHGKPLWLVALRRADIESFGLQLPADTIEMHLHGPAGSRGVRLSQGEKYVHYISLRDLLADFEKEVSSRCGSC